MVENRVGLEELRKNISPKALFLAVNGNKLLVHGILSNEVEKSIMRPPGGRIEFGEYSETTIRREMQEELNSTISNLRFLGSLENIFQDPQGNQYHEILFIYSGALDKKELYEEDTARRADETGRVVEYRWIPIKDLLNHTQLIVPEGIDKFLKMLIKETQVE